MKLKLESNPFTNSLIEKNELIYNPVDCIKKENAPEKVIKLFKKAKNKPFAVIVSTDGHILSFGEDQRNIKYDKINHPEKTAIVNALQNASTQLKKSKLDCWNLEKATLFTNIHTLGPMAYSESLWYNLSAIKVIADYKNNEIESLAQEIPHINNMELFKQVAVDYNHQDCPLQVVWNHNSKQANVAHLLWKAKIEMEKLKQQQSINLCQLEKKGYHNAQFIDQSTCPLSNIILSGDTNSHYDR